jgi:hypothetical protein
VPATPSHSDVLRDLADVRRTAAETLTELSRADLPACELRFALGHAATVLDAAGRTIEVFLAELE